MVLMLRRSLTFLRNTRIGPYLPVDLAVFAHKIMGYVVGVCVIGHFTMHMIHFSAYRFATSFGLRVIQKAFQDCCRVFESIYWRLYVVSSFVAECLENEKVGNLTYSDFLFTTKSGIGWITGAKITAIVGWPLLFVYITMFFSSLPVVRRSGMFEVRRTIQLKFNEHAAKDIKWIFQATVRCFIHTMWKNWHSPNTNKGWNFLPSTCSFSTSSTYSTYPSSFSWLCTVINSGNSSFFPVLYLCWKNWAWLVVFGNA